MIIQKGEGELRAVMISDGSPAVEQLIKTVLESSEIKNGMLRIVPDSPSALKEIKDHTQDLKGALVLRTCEVDTQNQGIHIISGDKALDQVTAKFIQAMRPALGIRESAEEFSSKLASELIAQKIPTIGFVVQAIDEHNEKGLEHAVASIRYLLHVLGLIDAPFVSKMVAVFKRTEIRSPHEGVFHPQLLLFEKVENGDLVGEIDAEEPMQFLSPGNGKIIELCTHKKVKKGDLLFSLGEEIGFYDF